MSLPIGELAKPQDTSTTLVFWISYGTKHPQTWPCGYIALLTVQLRGSDGICPHCPCQTSKDFQLEKSLLLDLAPFTWPVEIQAILSAQQLARPAPVAIFSCSQKGELLWDLSCWEAN